MRRLPYPGENMHQIQDVDGLLIVRKAGVAIRLQRGLPSTQKDPGLFRLRRKLAGSVGYGDPTRERLPSLPAIVADGLCLVRRGWQNARF